MIERKKMDELENEISSGEESDDSFHESDLDKYTSEEFDDEVCYATPPDSYKGKRVVKTFNENIQAKDIQWKLVIDDLNLGEGTNFTLISDQQKQFKSAMRSLEKLPNSAWEKMKQLDPEIHDMLMMRIHQNRDAMARRNCIIVPRQKQILDEAIKASAGMRALWDGREKYVVKGNGSSCEVSLKHRSCSCRVWDLTGMPCSHAVTAIQESRQHPVEFVAHWFTKETYMKTYSNYIKVIRGEEFWDDVLGDTILPPVIVKKLKGRPKKQRRKERWEGWEGWSVSHGKYKRMSYCGRVMHCGYCREEGHKINVFPTKPPDYVPKKSTGKMGRPKKAQVIEPDETQIEVELQSKEAATGEASLMDEMLQQMEEEAHAQESQQVLIRLGDDIQTEAHVQTKVGMKFMPTPGTRKSRGHVTGCTPPASTPPTATSQNQRKGKQISKSSQLSNSQTRTSSGSVSRKGVYNVMAGLGGHGEGPGVAMLGLEVAVLGSGWIPNRVRVGFGWGQGGIKVGPEWVGGGVLLANVIVMSYRGVGDFISEWVMSW
ncbi:hypothetical protein POM88_012634 [Heracleum sosnowskyi]|uniref:SWIM-type domain-containing protein n=1 Tax=Heracleum sosnowskyi TaxID=360622 RepID=A0AAD8IYH1_9APIA|nr:hypothetical protein POM88_012634 [Heracleum sosnowskyi]